MVSAWAAGVAYVDASHLEAYATDPHHDGTEDLGISDFLRTLMRQGYLPLLAPDLSRQRLEGCQLLVSIGPAREFSPAEHQNIKRFVDGGGVLICIAGAENAPCSEPLLADYKFRVPSSPVKPNEHLPEPEPLGAKLPYKDQPDTQQYRYYAAWPVECNAVGGKQWSVLIDSVDARAITVSQPEQGGAIVVIGDTHFACNENFRSGGRDPVHQIEFWRWLLSRVVPGQKPWNSPASTKTGSADAIEESDVMLEK
jgi:hypothetical protein